VVGVGHPELREALATAAAKAGVHVVRAVRRANLQAGASPSVTYQADGDSVTARCRLVIGADGKTSSVRTALGLPLSTTQARVRLTGMLVDDGGVWDRTETAISVDGRNQYIVVPRADNRLRLYVGRRADDPEPLKGPTAATEFLKAFRTPIFPGCDALADSSPIGPCATSSMNDAWVDEPVVPGAAAAAISCRLLSLASADPRLVELPARSGIACSLGLAFGARRCYPEF
jgi:2-polyprenyl-6-methoxyphenol hydroxylase-like FAD-dependent oxidoreductase